MEELTLIYRLGTALAIGLLVGLQREHAAVEAGEEKTLFAGVRTFPLIALAGATAAMLADLAGSAAVLVIVLAAVGLLMAGAYVARASRGDFGMTTEVAALVTCVIGALCFHGRLALAAALGVSVTVLLSAKLGLGRFVRRITRQDQFATLKFAVITAVVLPVLPNEPFLPAPFDALRPFQVWLMVVLISAIGFSGYVLIKLVGPRRGIGLTGLLGGLASSTAVTLSFAQRSRQRPELAAALSLAIIVSWAMMFLRVLVEVFVVNRALLAGVWPPLLAAALAGLVYCAWLYRRAPAQESDSTSFANPFELGPALRFGLLFAVVLVLARIAGIWAGEGGVYLTAVLAGTTDVDAITLSLAQLAGNGDITSRVAARAIVLAAIVNTAVKGALVVATGARELRRKILPGLLLLLLGGASTALLLR
jgi:uncharacterized membrane protein (DUF4010 family)